MPDALLSLVAHPLAVVADVRSQALRPVPRLGMVELLSRVGVDWRLSCKLRRNLDESLGDEHSHGIQVARMGFKPQPLRFERDRPTAAEGIEHRRRMAVG